LLEFLAFVSFIRTDTFEFNHNFLLTSGPRRRAWRAAWFVVSHDRRAIREKIETEPSDVGSNLLPLAVLQVLELGVRPENFTSRRLHDVCETQTIKGQILLLDVLAFWLRSSGIPQLRSTESARRNPSAASRRVSVSDQTSINSAWRAYQAS